MTLQQLEYIVAIDTHRHFGKAAEACFVTQPTLSGMVKKLEEELEARSVLKESSLFLRLARDQRAEDGGELRIGVIPTLAPYLLPLFLGRFVQDHPTMRLLVEELTTATIIDRLGKETLDVGLMATPLHVPGLQERPLFKERFHVFAAPGERVSRKRYVLPADIDPDRLWLLEEGHCMRSQVMNLCALRKAGAHGNLSYLSGSIASLMRMVETQGGVTIIPELATLDLDERARTWLHPFKDPAPAREISAVTYRHSLKGRLLELLHTAIEESVKPHVGRAAVQVVELEGGGA